MGNLSIEGLARMDNITRNHRLSPDASPKEVTLTHSHRDQPGIQRFVDNSPGKTGANFCFMAKLGGRRKGNKSSCFYSNRMHNLKNIVSCLNLFIKNV